MNKNLDNRIINLIIFNNIIWGVDEGIIATTCAALCAKLELNSDPSSMFTKLFTLADDRNKTKQKQKQEEEMECNWKRLNGADRAMKRESAERTE